MSGDQKMFCTVFLFTAVQAGLLLLRDSVHPLRRELRPMLDSNASVTVCGSDYQPMWSITFYRFQGDDSFVTTGYIPSSRFVAPVAMLAIFASFKAFEVRRSSSSFMEDIGYVGESLVSRIPRKLHN